MMLNWYLNLPFLEAVLVWLKLLLPVLFLLVVAMLCSLAWHLFCGGMKLSSPKLTAVTAPRKMRKEETV